MTTESPTATHSAVLIRVAMTSEADELAIKIEHEDGSPLSVKGQDASVAVTAAAIAVEAIQKWLNGTE